MHSKLVSRRDVQALALSSALNQETRTMSPHASPMVGREWVVVTWEVPRALEVLAAATPRGMHRGRGSQELSCSLENRGNRSGLSKRRCREDQCKR